MSKSARIIIMLTAAIVVCCLGLWGYLSRSQQATRVEVFRGDPAADVMKVVVDLINVNHQPAVDVEVSIQNNAGGSFGTTTREGRAIISVGEPIIEGLRVGGTNVDLGWRRLDARDRLRLVVHLRRQ
jgi:hypothetical protein